MKNAHTRSFARQIGARDESHATISTKRKAMKNAKGAERRQAQPSFGRIKRMRQRAERSTLASRRSTAALV
jgi:hypothetical protein